MSLNKNIKSDSLLALKSNWLKVIGITLVWLTIFLMCFIIETFVYALLSVNNTKLIIDDNIMFQIECLPTLVIASAIISLVYFAIFSILKTGDLFWNYSTIHGMDNDFYIIFNYYSTLKKILKSWCISIQIFIRKFFWVSILLLPSIVIGWWSTYATIYQHDVYDSILINFGYILSLLLAIVSIIICVIFLQRYFLTRYLIVSGECTKVRQAIKLSIKIMNGKKIDFILLLLSFSGWILSCILIIPIFFVFPYIKISLTLYSRYLVESYKNTIQEND